MKKLLWIVLSIAWIVPSMSYARDDFRVDMPTAAVTVLGHKYSGFRIDRTGSIVLDSKTGAEIVTTKITIAAGPIASPTWKQTITIIADSGGVDRSVSEVEGATRRALKEFSIARGTSYLAIECTDTRDFYSDKILIDLREPGRDHCEIISGKTFPIDL